MTTPVSRWLARAAVLLCLAAPTARAEPSPFQPGEELEYGIDFLGIRTAEGRISVGRPEGAVWPVMAQAQTDGIAKAIDIRQHWVSYWDAEARAPRGNDLRAVEMGYRHADRASFDRERGKATVVVQRKDRRTEDVVDVPRDAQDVAGAILWLRHQPMEVGRHIEVPVLTGTRVFTLTADVLGREAVSTPAGRFEAFKVQVRTGFSGKFSTKRDTFIWFSSDARRVPVRVSADFAVGSIVATLTSYRPGGELAQR
jgi:hypothetical protein